MVTAFLTGTTFLPAVELTGLDLLLAGAGAGFLATGFLTGAAFLTGNCFFATGFLTAAFLDTGCGFLTAAGFLAGAVFGVTAFLAASTGFFTTAGFLAGTAFLAAAFFTAGLATDTAFLAAAFLAGALALVFNLALALALCWVDFTAHLLSAGPGEPNGDPPTAVIFLPVCRFVQANTCFHLLAFGARIVLSISIVRVLA